MLVKVSLSRDVCIFYISIIVILLFKELKEYVGNKILMAQMCLEKRER